jgi:transcriptional regulator of acetoin/glycerol metabolism
MSDTFNPRFWDAALAKVRVEHLRQALVDHKGNVSRAARALSLSRSHANNLLRLFKLQDFARDLRVKNGGSIRGRQPGT